MEKVLKGTLMISYEGGGMDEITVNEFNDLKNLLAEVQLEKVEITIKTIDK